MKLFAKLDAAGGFYYERWSGAAVRSVDAALLAPRDKLHFFHDIGYRHEPFEHCSMAASHKKGWYWCTSEENFGALASFLFYFAHANGGV
jgi:alpha 1,2-mannosyltransferase